MNKMRVTSIVIGCLLLFGSAVAAAPLRLTFEADAVRATGFRAGASVVIFGAAIPPFEFYPNLVRYHSVLQADASGTVRYPVPRGVATHSVWFAVDQATAEYAVASPSGKKIKESELFVSIKHGADENLTDAFTVASAEVDVLLVKPGEGTWVDSLSSQGAKDLNRGRRDFLGVSVKGFRNINKHGPQADKLRIGDLLIAIDPQSLRVYVARLDKPGK